MVFGQLVLVTVATALVAISAAKAESEHEPIEKMSIARLEQSLAVIDAELPQLANYSVRSGTGTVGHRSEPHEDPYHKEWIQISLETETLIDQIILTPIIRRDTQRGLHGDGFPKVFEIIAGTDDDPNGTVIASHTADDQIQPNMAPLKIEFPVHAASWVRLETTELSPRNWDDLYILQLSEFMVFSGYDNVALDRPVRVSSTTGDTTPARRKETLVDGQLPYLMDAAFGDKSVAFFSDISNVKRPTITIDLGQSELLDRLHLHTAELSDTIPQAAKPMVGMPLHFLLEGAEKSDFSDAVTLTEYRRENLYDAGPIIMMTFPETRCRHVRLIIVESYNSEGYTTFGCAELELFSNGKNVALGKNVTLNYTHNHLIRKQAAITDGRNLFGEILPIRDWMGQLARRHELETLRPILAAALNQRYVRQKKYIQLLGWLVGILAIGSVLLVIRQQFARQKTVSQVRERIAANLHDELGANLYAISLLSDTAEKMVHLRKAEAEWSDLIEVINDVRELSQETGSTARFCANLLESEKLKQDLVNHITRIAERLLADLNHNLSISGHDFLNRLKPHVRYDLILFYKECLTNIIRHSGATDIKTQLTADKHHIQLTITDNGQGLNEVIPASLKRRASLLGAKLETSAPQSGGTAITLRLSTRRKLLSAKA